VVIPPCFIAKDVVITDSVVGPHVSIGKATTITKSVIENSIIQMHSSISNVNMKDSMIGSHANYQGSVRDLSIGDYSTIKE
jgi:glucose-1-phosphate thymidylyltransferase